MDDEHNPDLIVDVPKPLLLLGTSLIVSGVVITFYVASQVLHVYQSMDSNVFILKLKQSLANTELLVISGQSIVMGEASATTSAIALFALLAWIGISLGISLIRSGATIVSPVFKTELATLKLKMNTLTDKLEHNRNKV